MVSSKVILVTGASSGIGHASAEGLTMAGHKVYAASRTLPLCLDVRDEASVMACVERVTAAEGRLDALVHCPGVSLAGPIEETSIEEAKALFDTNFFGTVRMLNAVLPHMRARRAGRIVVVGSIGGLIGLPFIPFYSASKFALDGLIEALRIEVAPFGIQATVLHPGDTKTPIIARETVAARAAGGSIYDPAFRTATSKYDAYVRDGRRPEAVARDIERLLTMRRMPVRFISGMVTERLGVWLKPRVPSRMFEWIMRTVHGV